MLIMHFIATSIIFYLLSKNKFSLDRFAAYTMFFIVFESQFLMTLSFTNTSIILSCAGLTVLLFTFLNKLYSKRMYMLAFFCFVCAACFRIHAILPLTLIALPFFILPLNIKSLFRLIAFIVVVIFTTVLLNESHKFYYRKHIPNWDDKEAYAQRLYKFYNTESLSTITDYEWRVEQELIKNALIIDTNYLNSNKLIEIYARLKEKSRMINVLKDTDFYFLFVNNRIYFFTFFTFIFFYAVRNLDKIVAGGSFCFLMLCICVLIFFFKLPGYIIVGGLGLISLLTILYSNHNKVSFKEGVNVTRILLYSFVLLWGIIRLYKIDIDNKMRNNFFKQVSTEVAHYKDILFFVTDNSFPIDYCSIFSPPQKYPLQNVSLGWQYDRELNLRSLKLLKINGVAHIPIAPNILFWGKPIQALLDYFEITTGKKYAYSAPLKEFKYGEVRKLERVRD